MKIFGRTSNMTNASVKYFYSDKFKQKKIRKQHMEGNKLAEMKKMVKF